MYYMAHDAPREDPVRKDINHDHEPIMSPIRMETMADRVWIPQFQWTEWPTDVSCLVNLTVFS